MGIEPERLTEIVASVSDPLAPELASVLRSSYPELTFTVCSDDDVGALEPAVEADGFNVYLVDTSSHCLSLTPDMQMAGGLVIAWVEE